MNLIQNKHLWNEVICPISDNKSSPFTLNVEHLSYLNNILFLAYAGCMGKREFASVGKLTVSSGESIHPELIQTLIQEISQHGCVTITA